MCTPNFQRNDGTIPPTTWIRSSGDVNDGHIPRMIRGFPVDVLSARNFYSDSIFLTIAFITVHMEPVHINESEL